ncbi:hypothetical protein QQS21_005847 [Conoideocrella luteorostrata]|uniref:Uncharacterized protein n=1 Tax=Conoideocrella luteorostrata TaxID=1105319 RepID=A0AAJ0FTG0_9HYPO|nr:hypothetical protein QQS21_005847 [Conoideocrella luteorostrata]
MSKRFYIETSAAGKQQFVSIKRSRSHGHHHHHRDPCVETQDYYKVRVDEWNRLKERERCLEDTNCRLVAEVNTIKAALADAQGQAHHLGHVIVPQLQNQVNLLTADNEALRKSLNNACQNEGHHGREIVKLKQTIDKLEKDKRELKDENCSLKDRVKHLQRQVEQSCSRRTSELLREIDYWRDQCRYWKGKYENTKQVHDEIVVTLDIRTEKMRAYEEILKRRRII